MTIPSDVRSNIKTLLWDEAASADWCRLGQAEKARYYEHWSRDARIGLRLARYMDQAQVRVYIKDTLLKGYGLAELADPTRALRALGLDGVDSAAVRYTKPHGLRLADRRVLCWGRAQDWKGILMAVHERAFLNEGLPFAAVLTQSSGRYYDTITRDMVERAAACLGITTLVWLE
jgi:hypothetical protein